MSTKAAMKERVMKAWTHARGKRGDEAELSRVARERGDGAAAELHARREAYWWGYQDACAHVLEACGPKTGRRVRAPKASA